MVRSLALAAILALGLPLAGPLRADANGAAPPDLGDIYRIESSEDADAVVFPDSDWNLLSSSDDTSSPGQDLALAGWRMTDELPLPGSAATSYLRRVASDVEGVSWRMVGRGGERSAERTSSADGRSDYSFVDVKDSRDHLYVGKFRHQVEPRTAVSGRLMVKSDHLGSRDGLDLAAAGVPAAAARFGVETDLGGARVWGTFQINDWNGVAETGTSVDVSAVAVARASLLPAGLTDSPGTDPLGGTLGEAVSFEVGAAFPTEKAMGTVRYRRSSDGLSGPSAVARQQVGLQGEVTLQKDVTWKAGFERIYSTSGSYEQEESNVWTGIEIQF